MLFVAAKAPDCLQKATGGGIPACIRAVISDDVRELGGKSLSKLDTPLIEGIDAPDDALYEDLMLVKCDELTKDLWHDIQLVVGPDSTP